MRLTLFLAAGCALVAGCASATTSSPDTTSSPLPAGPPSSVTTVTRPPARRRRAPATPPRAPATPPRAPAPAMHGLPASSADAHAVQPQPPPGSCHARGTGDFSLPDARCTPGAIDPSVTRANIRSTICHAGYTATVRPSESVTGPEKVASMAAYGDTGSPHAYEYDHLVSLELGGARNDPRNLWPEPGGSPNVKDGLEDRLHALVCAGTISLSAAQAQIASDWVASYHRLVG